MKTINKNNNSNYYRIMAPTRAEDMDFSDMQEKIDESTYFDITVDRYLQASSYVDDYESPYIESIDFQTGGMLPRRTALPD